MKKAPKGIKRKGYYVGTNRDGVQREQGSPMDRGTGTVGALDKYGNPVSDTGMEVDEVSTTQLDKSGNAKQPSANELKMRGAANTAGNALGGYGSGYYATNVGETKGENIRAGGMSAVSKMGGIGGAIGGLAAIGDQIGAPIKKRAEKVDNTGNVINEKKAKQQAIGGSLLSPSKALAYRSDSGNWGDVSGKQYLDYIEKPYKEQIEAEKKDAAQAQLDEAMAARERGEVGYTAVNKYKPHEFKKGGTIKGKGTGTSDSINAEVEEGSFVVPEKFASTARMIKSALGMKKGKADLHQKSGVPVKLSNGEELLTPEQKNKVKNKLGEETLEALAPEANETDGFAKGGEIPKGTVINGAKWDGKNWTLGATVYSPEVGKKYEEEYYKKQKDSKSTDNSWLDEKYNKMVSGQNEELQKEYDSLKDKKDEVSVFRKKEIEKKIGKPKPEKQETLNVPTFNTKDNKPKAEGKKTPSAKPSVNAQKIWEDSLKFTPKTITDEEVNIDTQNILNPNANAIDTVPVTKTEIDKPFMDSIAKGKAEYEAEKKATNKPSFWDKVGNANTEGLGSAIANYGLAAYQIKKGKEGLKGDRPIDKIDPTFQSNVDTAQANAKFGFTPEQQFMLDQQNQNLLNADTFAAKNYSGGSGGNAFNMQRNASNNAFMRSLQNASANTELQQQKQGFAANLALQKANMSRNIFEDSLRAFEQKNQAAGNLVANGFNTIQDTNRFANYMKLRNQENEFNKKYNG